MSCLSNGVIKNFGQLYSKPETVNLQRWFITLDLGLIRSNFALKLRCKLYWIKLNEKIVWYLLLSLIICSCTQQAWTLCILQEQTMVPKIQVYMLHACITVQRNPVGRSSCVHGNVCYLPKIHSHVKDKKIMWVKQPSVLVGKKRTRVWWLISIFKSLSLLY